MQSKIGVAIIGCGYWGVNYIRIFSELPNAEVIAICDQRVERLKELEQRFPNVQGVTSIDEVLQMDNVQAAIICTGAKSHYQVARACLEGGLHLLVEKPLTTSSSDSLVLTELADRLSLTLMVGHTFIFNSAIDAVRQLISEDPNRQVHYLYSRRTNLGPIRHDVNAFWDLAPHDVSIFNELLDSEPVWVSATGVDILQSGSPDAGFASIGYANGVVGNIHISWADPNKVREMVVVCNDRRIVFDDVNPLERVKVYEKGVTPAKQEVDGFGEFQFLLRDGAIFSPKIEMSEPLKTQSNHFIECIQTKQSPITGGNAGTKVVQVMEAIDESVRLNGAPVPVGDNALPLNANHDGHYVNGTNGAAVPAMA